MEEGVDFFLRNVYKFVSTHAYMLKKGVLVSLVFLIVLLGLVTAQTTQGYRNPTVPFLQSGGTTTPVVSGGGNVTSVTSGDNCIFVNPTTGIVVITFNTSCGSGGAVDSVTSGDDFLIFNPTTGNVVGRLNTTTLNVTIDNRINSRGFLNSSVANQTYYLITNPSNFINITTGQFFNDTAFINSVNSSIWSYINTNQPSWLTTFNATYNNILNQTCPTGNYSYGIQSNGTILCRSDASGGGGDFFFANFTTSFNLNLTAALPLANRTLPHCSNVTGQTTGVCPTSDVTFRNLTVQNITARFGRFDGTQTVDVDLGQDWYVFCVVDCLAQLGYLSSSLGVFQFKGGALLDLYFTSFDLSTQLIVGASGTLIARVTNTFYVDNPITSVRSFETNSTRTQIYGNSTLSGLNNTVQNNLAVLQNFTLKGRSNDWACPFGSNHCTINATGFNITSNHQSYTGTAQFDTTFTNNHSRPIYIDFTFESGFLGALDVAYVSMYVNGSLMSQEGLVLWDGSDLGGGDGTRYYHHLGGTVQPGMRYSFNSTTLNNGFVNAQLHKITVI